VVLDRYEDRNPLLLLHSTVICNQKKRHSINFEKYLNILKCGVSTIITDDNKMKKFTIILTVLIAMAITTNAQKGEITGKISAAKLTALSDSNKIVINNNTLIINSATIISGQFVTRRNQKGLDGANTRVRVFYRVEDNVKVASKIVEEKLLVPSFRIIKPIPSYIPPTVISGIGMGNLSDLGKITSWGFGVGAEARIYNGIRLFFDMTNYSYKQELAEKGSTNVSCYIGTGSRIDIPLGAKYTTATTAIRLGIKYVFLREKDFQPWIGMGYGLHVWKAQYITWDEKHIYGKANGVTPRNSILAGVDFKLLGNMTFSVFFEAVSPVANYTMDLPLFGGTFSTFEGMTFPTPRIGISLGGF